MNDLTVQEKLWEAEAYIERQKEEIKRLEDSNKKLANMYVKSFCSYVEMLNTYLPGWRNFAKNELEALSAELNRGK